VDPQQQLAAAPIWDDQGQVAASLVLNAQAHRMTAEWCDALKGTAQHISRSLGGA
jgi:DNA-binding IclR family transcriptional regulator